MVQPGRVVLPMEEKQFSETWSVFKHTPLMKYGAVIDLPQMSSDEVQVIEDCNETAPPSFTGSQYQPPKGERVFQLGDVACTKILESCVNDIGGSSATKPIVLVVDLTTHTGDFTRAFTHLLFGETGKTHHLYYSGFCETDTEAGLHESK